MADYDSMTEDALRTLQEEKNAEANALREERSAKNTEVEHLLATEDEENPAVISLRQDIASLTEAIKAKREEVLAIQAAGDLKQLDRYAEYQRIAEESGGESSTVNIDAEIADAVSEAEKLTGG